MQTLKTPHLILGVVLATCPPVLAATILDQQFVPGGGNGLIVERSTTVAQTFKVGWTGLLDGVEVELARKAILPPDGVTLEIRSTVPDGSPADNVLARVPIAAADIATTFQFVRLDLAPFRIAVTQSDMLALVLRSEVEAEGGNIDPFAWGANELGGYSRGSVYIDHTEVGAGFVPVSGWDVGFRTYVDAPVIPEPSTAALFGLGISAWLSRRLRRHGVV